MSNDIGYIRTVVMSASFIGFVLLPGKYYFAYRLTVGSTDGGSAHLKPCTYRDNTSMLAVVSEFTTQTLEKQRANTSLKIVCVPL